jgi:hypothetical protein
MLYDVPTFLPPFALRQMDSDKLIVQLAKIHENY